MAKQLATQELVFEAARAITDEGAEPSILTVQAKIGGGSYTTIKRHLDAWVAHQAIAAQASIETPSAVLDKSTEFGRTLWAMAIREASKDALAAKELAESKVTANGKELEFAQHEIRRMEESDEAQREALESVNTRLQSTETALVDARLLASKVPDLEARLESALASLNLARQEATDRAVEAGRLAGESESLRGQLREMTAALISSGKATP